MNNKIKLDLVIKLEFKLHLLITINFVKSNNYGNMPKYHGLLIKRNPFLWHDYLKHNIVIYQIFIKNEITLKYLQTSLF